MIAEGQLLDDTYRLLRLVGEGGMGVVYEATHARLAGRYAIKVLTQQFAESPEGLAQFDREARITSLLQHPNIVQVIDHNTAPDGTEYLVMELLAGESLSQRLAREGRLPLEAVVDIIDQIAAGLSAAHARGIVHRDLKPDNVILVPIEGRQAELVKLLDFGISKRHGSLGVSRLICGTPQYMAPEQVEGRVLDVDASTDQFALAVIAQELLTGRNPFAADDVDAVFARVSSEPPMTVGLGSGLDAVLGRALDKSGRRRFRSVTDFADAFHAAALACRRSSQRPSAVATTDRSYDLERRRRARRRAGTAILGAAAATIAICLVADRGPSRVLAIGRALSAMVEPVQGSAGPDRPDGSVPQAEPVADPEPPTTQPIAPPLVIAPTQPSERTDGGRSAHARARAAAPAHPTSHARASRPRPAPPVDDDATMPLTELGHEPNP